MKAKEVLAILALLDGAGVAAWLDGGWGVDALLGLESRAHADLDLVLDLDHVALAVGLLEAAGFAPIVDELPTRIELSTPAGLRLDLHPVRFDAEGGGVQRLQDGADFRYPPEGFAGSGLVAGCPVRCLTPEVQLLCHSGYEPDADDRHDVALLCARFSLPRPPGYA